MERKVELKDIAGYLPYELKILDTESKLIYPFLGYEIDTTLTKILLYDSEEDWWNLSNFMPILRPLSDLYREITHNGDKIVPIVELAKSQREFNWEVGKDDFGNSCAKYGEIFFGFKNHSFYLHDFSNDLIYCQYALFDYLHELKIDYRQLCKKGLAISVYDLDKNPYE